jgi:hypothetical protein
LILNQSLDVGDAGIRVIGSLWLVAAAGLIAAAILVWGRSPRGVAAVVVATALSLVMCLVGLPASRIGAAIDLLILGSVAVMAIRRRSLGQVSWLSGTTKS